MKDYTQAELEETLGKVDVVDAVGFCLKKLYDDQVHVVTEEIVHGLTFEEVIGALLLAKEVITDEE